MTIDPRTTLGRTLETGRQAEIDLSQLSQEAGELLASRIDGDTTREEAVIGLVNHAAKLMAGGVVSLDTTLIFSSHSVVEDAVNRQQKEARTRGTPESIARSMTRILIVGSRHLMIPSAPKERDGSSDLLGSISDLFENITGRGTDRSSR